MVGSGSSGILYGMIPWTAGGDGDPHLAGVDQTSGYACQDGGFEPQKKPGGEIEEKEREKPESAKEKEELEQAPAKKKREHEQAREEGLAKPHDQEPNQLQVVGPDGGYDEGLADLIVNQIATEQQDIVTDPLLNGWKDSEGSEVTDECRNFFVPTVGGSSSANANTKAGTLVQPAVGSRRLLHQRGLQPRGGPAIASGQRISRAALSRRAMPSRVRAATLFTAPNLVKGGESVGFDGMESDITLGSAVKFSGGVAKPNYATYTWNFGDASWRAGSHRLRARRARLRSAVADTCAASVFHTYKYTGTYEVTLTVTDVGGNKAQRRD